MRVWPKVFSRSGCSPRPDRAPPWSAEPPEPPEPGAECGMEIVEVERWFASYLGDFVALGRGDTDDGRRLLAHYGVPLLLSTDVASTLLSDEAQVLAFAQQQIDGMRSAGYDGSVELTSETVILNRSCALHRGQFSRVRSDGTQIGRLEASYLITDGPTGRRISAIIVHSPT